MRQVAALAHAEGWVEPAGYMQFVAWSGSDRRLGSGTDSTRKIVQAAVSNQQVDWAYFAAFSDFDDSVWVSGYQGVLLRVSPGNGVLASWVLPSSAIFLSEVSPGVAVVSTLKSTSIVADGHPPHTYPSTAGVTAVAQGGVAHWNGAILTYLPFTSRQRVRVDLGGGNGAFYSTSEGLHQGRGIASYSANDAGVKKRSKFRLTREGPGQSDRFGRSLVREGQRAGDGLALALGVLPLHRGEDRPVAAGSVMDES